MIVAVPEGVEMCHERWLQHRSEEREASRRLWDEFERTWPLRDLEVTGKRPRSRSRSEPMPRPAEHRAA
jgi:hypothetical protein